MLRKQWYPIVFSKDLKNEPYGIALLGDPLVLYRDNKGVPQCLVDVCPHRSIPLSLGAVKNGELECDYHGWRFGTGGVCTIIPSVTNTPTKANCATSYPVVEELGFIWVWPVPGDSDADPAKIPREVFPEVFDSSFFVNVVHRDINVDHGLMIENLTDPAHIPFAHRLTIGKRTRPTEHVMSMDVIYDTMQKDPEVEEERDSSNERRPHFVPPKTPAVVVLVKYPLCKDKPDVEMSFIAPFITRFTAHFNKGIMTQIHFNVPITRTKMRLFAFITFKMPAIAMFFLRLTPTRVWDNSNNTIIDEDVRLVGGQQVRLWRGAKPWVSTVSADKIGVRYRKWRQKQEEAGSIWFESFSTPIDVEDLALLAPGAPPSKTNKKKKDFYETYPIFDDGGKDFHAFDVRPPLISIPSWMYTAFTVLLSVGVTFGVHYLWGHHWVAPECLVQ